MSFLRLKALLNHLGRIAFAQTIGQGDPWRWLVFALCVAVVGIGDLGQAERTATEKFSSVAMADWAVTNVWIVAAECGRKTGAWLVLCQGEKLVPIANGALADDPGHAFFLGIAAQILDRAVAVVDVARLNIAIDYFGMVSIAALLFAVRSYVACMIVLILGDRVYLDWIAISPHPGLIGAASFAAILPIAIVLSEQGNLGRIGRLLALAVGAVLLGAAALLREPIGTMGLLVGVGSVAVMGFRRRNLKHVLRLFALLVLVVVSWQTPRWILLARDTLFSVTPTNQIQTHGTSHNLYLGLGAIENKFGIRWSDSDGAEAVAKVNPKVSYVSEEYFQILWKLYLKRLTDDPLEVARIYMTKGVAILEYRFPDQSLPLWMVLGGIAGVLFVGRKARLWNEANYEQGLPFLYVGLAFVALFILQGAVAHHNKPYAHPIGAFVLLFFAVGLEFFVRFAFYSTRRSPPVQVPS